MTDKRNPWYIGEVEEYRARLNSFVDEGGGLARMFLIRKEDHTVVEKARQGDMVAIGVARCIGRAFAHMQNGNSMLCLCCLTDVTKKRKTPGAFVVIVPGSHDHEQIKYAMTAPICATCAKRNSDTGLIHDATLLLGEAFNGVEIVDSWSADA